MSGFFSNLTRANSLSDLAAGGAYKFASGSAAAPSIAFASDPDTGFYRVTDDLVGVATGGIGAGSFGRNGAGGGLAIYATGTNQSITLNPSGTGTTALNAASSSTTLGGLIPALQLNQTSSTLNALYGIAFRTSGNFYGAFIGAAQDGTGNVGNTIRLVNKDGVGAWNEGLRILTNDTFLFGTATNSSNGRLQLATHTTSAGGIGFGTEHSLYRTGTSSLAYGTTTGQAFCINSSSVGAGIGIGGSTISNGDFQFTYSGTALFINTLGGRSIILGTNSTAALTLDASQNATFAGQLRLTNPVTPASAAASGTVGTIAWDTSYIYVCIAASTWRRVAHATW